MRNGLVVSMVALICAGCASNRMDNDWFSTAGTQFSIRKDPIVPVGPRVKEKAPKKDAKSDKPKPKPTYYDNPNLEKMIAKYYQRSIEAERLEEARSTGGEQIEAKPQSPYANALIDYRAAGFDASRGICEYALNRLGEAHSDYRFANKSFNVGSGAVSSLMGIFQASAQSIAVTSTSTALLQAWSQDFEEYAYLTASIGTVGEKVKAAQDTYRKGVEGYATDPAAAKVPDGPKGKYDVIPPRSWSDATLQIQQYNSFCLATGMRALIEKAVGKADVYFDKDTGSVEFFSTQNLTQLQLALRQKQLLEQQRQIDDAQWQVTAAEARLQNGSDTVQQAKATIAKFGPALQLKGFYDTGTNTIDMAKVQAAVTTAEAAAKAANPSDAGLEASADAAELMAQNALKVQKALADLAQYDSPTWRSTTNQEIQEARTNLQKLQATLGAQPAAPVSAPNPAPPAPKPK